MANTTIFFVSYVSLWVITGVLFAAVFLLYRHFGQVLLEQREFQEHLGPKLNERASVTLKTVEGSEYSLVNGQGHVLLFATPGCQHCEHVKAVVGDLVTSHGVVTIVVYAADKKATRDYAAAVSGIAISDPTREILRAWNVRATPYFVVTDSQAVVRKKGRGSSREAIAQYFDAAVRM